MSEQFKTLEREGGNDNLDFTNKQSLMKMLMLWLVMKRKEYTKFLRGDDTSLIFFSIVARNMWGISISLITPWSLANLLLKWQSKSGEDIKLWVPTFLFGCIPGPVYNPVKEDCKWSLTETFSAIFSSVPTVVKMRIKMIKENCFEIYSFTLET